ncbi:hypothetical protein V1291_005089 [Nitrobacteraceae bacterium AZCC 1564]
MLVLMMFGVTRSYLPQLDDGAGQKAGHPSAIYLVPALAAMLYPFILRAFHHAVIDPSLRWSAPFVLAAAFAVPASGFAFAMRKGLPASMRRLAFASVVAPTLFVFLGVVQALVSSPLPDEVPWLLIWSGLAILAWVQSRSDADKPPIKDIGYWRVAHGVSGAIVMLYVLFHVTNHLFGLIGPAAHATVMNLGRHVYRALLIEPLLVVLMLFQVCSGLRLAWLWSAQRGDFYRTFQVASGFYLVIFIVGHMNSVFVYARRFLGIPTDWAFATGAPTGLIYDAWNIRLFPHYALGVFFVLTHLASGLRVVLLAHGVREQTADRIWNICAGFSLFIAIAIIAGMSGVRLASQ